jgi:hypothetical protein
VASIRLAIDHAWDREFTLLSAFLHDVGALDETTTTSVTLHPMRLTEDEAQREVPAIVNHPRWTAALRHASDPGYTNLFLYEIEAGHPRPPFGAFLWLEPHSQASAWWLINAWRVGQFGSASIEAFERYQLLVAAACTRSLVEAAAALYSDTKKFADVWDACKTTGPSYEYPVPPEFSKLREWCYEVLAGGRFDTDSWAKATAERVKRTSVKTHVDKLAKLGATHVLEDYDWLCNTVHPSMGACFAFTGPYVEREPKIEALITWAQYPRHSFPANDLIDVTIADVIRRASTLALRVARVSLDWALRIIDDIGLTTKAPDLARFESWRQLPAVRRNEACPCRSGRKAKDCLHEWHRPGPPPPTFELPSDSSAQDVQ